MRPVERASVKGNSEVDKVIQTTQATRSANSKWRPPPLLGPPIDQGAGAE